MKHHVYPIIAALLATAHSLPAATYTWTGTTSGAWDTATPANWGGTTPAFNNTADVVFNAATPIATYNTFLGGAARTVRSINFTGAFTAPLEIRTNQNNATARMLNLTADSGSASLNVDASVGALVTIGQGTGTDNNGTVSLGSDLSVVHNGSANLVVSRPINESVAGRSITKSGSGTLLLSGANTYTGATTINAGILRLGNANGLGATSGDTVVNAGGTLDVNNNIIPAGESVSIAGAGQGGIGALYSNSGNSGTETKITDGLILTADASVGAPSGIRYGVGHNGSPTTGNFTLTKVGAGQFDLRGPVTIGDIVVQQGAFQTEGAALYNNGLLTLNSGTEFRVFQINNPFPRNIVATDAKIFNGGSNLNGDTIAGNITLNGTNSFESNGAETTDKLIFTGNIGEGTPGAAVNIGGVRRVVLSGTNTYTGLTSVNTGALELSGSLSGPISVAPSTTLDGEGSTTGSITFANGANLQFNPSTTGANQYLRAADVIIAPGEAINVTATAPSAGASAVILHDNNGGLDLNSFILFNAGRGVLSLGGTGGTSDLIYNFQAANLEWRAYSSAFWGVGDASNNFQNLGTAAHDDFLERDNVDFTDAATGTVTLIQSILAGTVNFKNTAGNDLSIQPTSIENLDAFAINKTSSGNVILGAALTGTASVTAGGSGTLTLAGNNTNTGAITVNGGSLILSGTNPSTASLTVNAGALQVGTGGTTGTWAGSIVNNGSVAFNRSDNLTYNGVISGSGTFTKDGTGTLTLGGNSSYTGLTTVNAGALQIGAGAAAGTIGGDLQVQAGAFADFNRSDATTYAGTITGSGSINKRATGTVTLTGNNSFSGGLNIYNGVLIAGDANLGSGPITMGPGLANTNTLSLTGSTDNEIFFSNGGTGNKIINLATGATDATLSGTIHLDADPSAVAGVSRISPVAGGTIVIAGKMTGSGVAGYTKRNTGTVVITNNTNDYTGPTHVVDNGTLLVNGRVPGNLFFGETVGVGTNTGSGGVLGGSGSIGGNVKLQNASRISPGGTSAAGVNTDTQATLTINGSLDVSLISSSTGKIILQLGALAGTNDKIRVDGGLALGTGAIGLSEFNITNSGGLQAGTYTLISTGTGITGTLDPADLSAEISPGLTGTLAISGNNLVLTVGSGGNPYTTWTSSFPGLTNTDFEFDFDGDGISTGLEWVLGGNPTLNDTAAIAPTVTANATSGITLSFKREEDSIGAVTLAVEYGGTLAATWPKAVLIGAASSGPDANGVVVTVNAATDPDTVTVNIPASNAVGGKLFARLKATQP
ncbi:autotransporter-associated beta strand repeat-containing protein [Haloferula sp. BvORR071]|uniref:beta strand repeat-containing protein n=1 Tax=Haloferula sp. BvORR071 TaxID=1396141 RepID=UPI002240EF46|nr:autotransporter-associated beta strand repeat-containing protein [Haloferula sp. BvORR071]